MHKSPFLVFEEFLSPMMCEDVVDLVGFSDPDKDKDDKPVATFRTNETAETFIFNRLLTLVPDLEQYYGLEYKGTERIQFEWFPTGSVSTPRAENADYIQGKWLRTRSRDLTAVLFMSDYQDKVPFSAEFEAYGGKLEFPQHRFGFNPQRGTLIVFPSDPHFINLTSFVLAGDAYQARINIAAKVPYIYQPQQFQGNFTTWF